MILIMDGFNNCIAGVCTRYGQPPILIYDRSKVISKLESDGLTNEEAEEYFDFNIIGAWVGDETPAFMEPYKDGDQIRNAIDS